MAIPYSLSFGLTESKEISLDCVTPLRGPETKVFKNCSPFRTFFGNFCPIKQIYPCLKEMRIPDHLTCLLRNLYADQEAKLELDMEEHTGSK